MSAFQWHVLSSPQGGRKPTVGWQKAHPMKLHPVMKLSPISVRVKPNGKFRLLHDLSFPYDSNAVNKNIADRDARVDYPSIREAISIFNCLDSLWLSKADLKDAYRQLPLAPDQYWLMGFRLEGAYYYDLRLPMGARSSCRIFERVSSALAFALKSSFGVRHIVKMLDDFLFIGDSKEECQRALDSFNSLCREINFPWAEEKTVAPTKRLTFLGYQLDVRRGTVSIPEDKVEST